MDKRVRKTKQVIKDCLSELITEKPYNAITITELCSNAKINRGTFYLHFRSVIEAIKKFENEVLSGITDIINKQRQTTFDYQVMMIDIANYIKKEKDFLKAILSNNGDINFVNSVKKKMYEVFMYEENKAIRLNDSGFFGNAYATFIISGGIGLFEEWIENDCRDDIYTLILPFEIGFLRLSNLRKISSLR